MNNKRNILATTALDYANGDLHLGHILEKIQADLWVRSNKLVGNNSWLICGDDAHGTPIMLKAKELGITAEELIAIYFKRHLADLTAFCINCDHFDTTHSMVNQEIVNQIYNKLLANQDLELHTIEQLYDPIEKIFLPDRYVKGICPRCEAKEQYGDNCEGCGAHYDPFELKEPRSILTGATPIIKKTKHYFFDLPKYKQYLINWLQNTNPVSGTVLNKLNEWLHGEPGLQAWDISRDPPYFGFLIPGSEHQYFYVWLDAPIGYLAIAKQLANKDPKFDFVDCFTNAASSSYDFYHFIGKDIVYFHTLFWPSLLKGAGLNLPKKILVHGFLTINGEKMSKSRGTFITAKQYLKYLPAEYLRYYFAAKLSNHIEDLDLNFDDFISRINADLIGKFVNIASRCAGFINKYFADQLADELFEAEIYGQFIEKRSTIMELFLNLEYAKAIKEIMNLADLANKYIDLHKPWILIKQINNFSKVQAICTTGLNLFRVLMIYLQPILPQTFDKVKEFFNDQLNFVDLADPLLNHKINQFQPLMYRIEQETINNMRSDQSLQKTNINNIITETASNNPAADPGTATQPTNIIGIDDFAKIDLRVAKIINAEDVPNANKLLKLTVDVGELGIKQVFAGIKKNYLPAELIGKFTVIVANLAERKMPFGVSQGMILAASSNDPNDSNVWIIEPNAETTPGMKIK